MLFLDIPEPSPAPLLHHGAKIWSSHVENFALGHCQDEKNNVIIVMLCQVFYILPKKCLNHEIYLVVSLVVSHLYFFTK